MVTVHSVRAVSVNLVLVITIEQVCFKLSKCVCRNAMSVRECKRDGEKVEEASDG